MQLSKKRYGETMQRRTFSWRGSSLVFTGMIAGCSTKVLSTSETDPTVIRATNYSDSEKRITVVGESSEGTPFFEKQLTLHQDPEETRIVATVEPQKRGGAELINVIVTVEGGQTRTIKYNPDSQGNEDVDLRIYADGIRFNYD